MRFPHVLQSGTFRRSSIGCLVDRHFAPFIRLLRVTAARTSAVANGWATEKYQFVANFLPWCVSGNRDTAQV